MNAPLRLRESTADCHSRVDTLVRPLLDGGVDGYREFLSVTQRIVVPWERELRRFSWPAEVRIEERLQKSEWLAADLGPAHASEFVASVANPFAAWGALYVFEGSTLGSAMIAKQLDGVTFRYLRGYGPDNPTMWSSFKAALADAIASEQQLAESVGAARQVFAQFEEALA